MVSKGGKRKEDQKTMYLPTVCYGQKIPQSVRVWRGAGEKWGEVDGRFDAKMMK